jgi:hypothetical protein
MATFDLLDAVLPKDGWFCITGIKDEIAWQRLVETREEADDVARDYLDGERDVYFGCAKFETGQNRKADNAKYFKAVWLDIDCGPTKAKPNPKTGKIDGYIDQHTGLQELQRFCKTIGLPKPVLVNSGRGIHVYWLFTETIEKDEWWPIALRMKELCDIHNLIVDQAVFDAARVLRVPGTLNFKDDPPKPVEVLSAAEPIAVAELVKIIGVPVNAPKQYLPKRKGAPSALTMALMKNRTSSFKAIMMKSAEGEGCNQLLHCYQNQDSIDYNLWRSGLSIAAFCEDAHTAAHKLSNKYPGYDPSEVDEKLHNLQTTGGPHHCETFARWNPGGCEGCKHKGTITSPIMLGKQVAQAEVTEGNYAVEVEDEEGEATPVFIPEFPFPYFRGKTGGIYKNVIGEADPLLVYEHDLYVQKRMYDPDVGEIALIRLHLPHDGVKEFSMPAAALAGKDEPKKLLAAQGVLAHKGQMELIVSFIITCAKNMQITKKAEVMRTQFGWVDNDSKFIVGEREITVEGDYYSPPSSATKSLARYLIEFGELEKWKEVFNLYTRPGMEPNAFAALTGFGAPLFRFTNHKGAIINLVFRGSGSGKSTTLAVCNSIWGHPDALMSIPKDTVNAKMLKLGVMNHLPYTMDEITNMSAEEFSDMTYAMSQGRWKDRVKASTNELRLNTTFWNTISLCSSNAHFADKLGSLKSSPDGEMMRLMEYQISYTNTISVEEGKRLFDYQLRENYGLAGGIYARWLIANRDEAIRLLKATNAKIDKELRITQRERFWSAVVAANITGGLIAKSLGLHDYDMKKIYQWASQMIMMLRKENSTSLNNATAILGDYINRHVQHALVINGTADARTNLNAAPLQEPRGPLTIRYEPDTKKLFIQVSSFKDDCAKLQISFSEVLKELTLNGIFKGRSTRRLGTGMKIISVPTYVLEFDCSETDLFNIKDFVPVEQSDADREHQLPDQLESVPGGNVDIHSVPTAQTSVGDGAENHQTP